MGNMQGCIDRAIILRSDFLHEFPHFEISGRQSHCFRVHWGQDIGVSVSYPPDANEHADRYGWVIETALWCKGDSEHKECLLYCGAAGYDDIRRFSTREEAFAEIRRVKAYFEQSPHALVSEGFRCAERPAYPLAPTPAAVAPVIAPAVSPAPAVVDPADAAPAVFHMPPAPAPTFVAPPGGPPVAYS